MDLILDAADHHFFTPYVYPLDWPRSYLPRQFLSLLSIVLVSGYALYFSTAGLNYWLVFDKKLLKHPQTLKNQVRQEIQTACTSIPVMALLSAACFVPEVRGWSKLYEFGPGSATPTPGTSDWLFIAFTLVAFILFTDCLIYWLHRTLHHPSLYKYLHKAHHAYKVPTPFASHAFHPVDGFLQSAPYHIYLFLFPMHKITFLFMFLAVNIWTVSVHDGDFRVPRALRPFVNGTAHHSDHHLYFNYNFGQFLTLWDRLGGSFKNPAVYDDDNKTDKTD